MKEEFHGQLSSESSVFTVKGLRRLVVKKPVYCFPNLFDHELLFSQCYLLTHCRTHFGKLGRAGSVRVGVRGGWEKLALSDAL